MARLRADGVTLLPLYTGDGDAHGQHQQRHLSRHRRRARPDRAAARGGEEEQRQAGRRRRLRLRARPGRCADRSAGRHAGRALQPRAHVPRGAVLLAALVSEAPERPDAAGPPRRRARRAADRGELQGAARRRTRPGRRSMSTACIARRRSRWSSATCRWAATRARPISSLVSTRGHLADHVGAQRRRPRRLGREAARRERQVPRAALQARRHARGHDRRSQPRSARARRGQVHEAADRAVWSPSICSRWRSGVGADRFLRPLDARQDISADLTKATFEPQATPQRRQHRRLFRRRLRRRGFGGRSQAGRRRRTAAARRDGDAERATPRLTRSRRLT